MNSLGLTQRSFTPRELARLQATYDAVIGRVGPKAPLGLKEAIAAEIMMIAGQFEGINESELLARIEPFLEDCRYA